MKVPFLRSAYNYDRDAVSDETGLSCPEPTMAQQQFRDECDINTIMEKFGQTGQVPTSARMPQYGDFTGITDYHTAINAVIQAEESFGAMDAKIRARFDNDPGRFVEFCLDENNRDEAIKLGLIEAVSTPAEPVKASPSGDAAQ
jgi:phage internal scaffolding protein